MENSMKIKLHNDIVSVLDLGNIWYTDEAIDFLIDKWETSKSKLIEKFMASPNYAGDYRIKVPVSESRGFSSEFINNVFYFIKNCINDNVENGDLREKMCWLFTNLLYTGSDGTNYRCRLQVSDKLVNKLTAGTGKYEDSNIAIREGMSTLSLTLKLLKYYHIDELLGSYINEKCALKKRYNKIETDLGDAFNPKSVERDLYISLNPVDYLLMGDFVSGGSCYNIFEGGCCQAGTLSYMCDEQTFLTFTTDDIKKLRCMMINRQVWFINSDNDLLQSRLYPQKETRLTNIRCDWATSVIKEFSKMFNREYEEVYNGCDDSYGFVYGRVGYIDPLHNFTFTIYSLPGKIMADVKTFNVAQKQYYTDIVGGYEPEGSEGETGGAFDHINKGLKECCQCGRTSDLHCIDGEWYCENCCFYCDYHARWEVGESCNVEGYGRVCDDALDNSGDFHCCERCRDWYYCDNEGDEVEVDGNYYCCEDCALRDGNIKIDGNWYSDDEAVSCDMCGGMHLLEDTIYTLDGKYFCCKVCAEEAGYIKNEDGEWVKKEQEETAQVEEKDNIYQKELNELFEEKMKEAVA